MAKYRLASGYSEAGASNVRRALKGFIAESKSPAMDIDLNNKTMRQRGRMLYMSAPVAASAINTNRTKVIGTGLALKSAVNREVLGLSSKEAKAWQRKTESEFRLWASKKDHCDATGINTFEGLQQLAVMAWLMSGDVFALRKQYEPSPGNPYGLRIHLIEADRVSTPSEYRLNAYRFIAEGENKNTGNKIHDGVEVDKFGRVVAYHVCNQYPDVYSAEPPEWTRVEAYGSKTGTPNILHIMSAERPDQYRGVTYLAQVIEPLLNLNRYTQSELMSAMIQSFFSAWIKTKTDVSGIPFNEVGDGTENDEGVSSNQNEYEMGPGIVNHLAEGEDVVFGNPNIPTSGFETFVKTIGRMVGAALEIPHDVLMKEFNASYSASRAALMEAWEAFRMRRKWLVDDLCQPVYEMWLAEAVARGRVKAPGFFVDPMIRAAWSGAHWIGPVQGHLDPVKEVKADSMAVSEGFKTREQVMREYGNGDWFENIEQIKRENESMADAKAEPNIEDTPDTEEEQNK